MKKTYAARTAKTVRRSFALPGSLLEEAISVASNELKDNLNRLVTVALQEYVDSRKRLEFEKAMEQMGRDPQILSECAAIQSEFAVTEMDGLVKKK